MIWKNEIDNGTRLNRKTSDIERGKNIYLQVYFWLKNCRLRGAGAEGVRVKYKLEKAFFFLSQPICPTHVLRFYGYNAICIQCDCRDVFKFENEHVSHDTISVRVFIQCAYGVRSDDISSPFRRPLPGPTVLNGYGAANLRFAVSRSPGDNVTFPFVGWRGEETVYENEYVSAAV